MLSNVHALTQITHVHAHIYNALIYSHTIIYHTQSPSDAHTHMYSTFSHIPHTHTYIYHTHAHTLVHTFMYIPHTLKNILSSTHKCAKLKSK